MCVGKEFFYLSVDRIVFEEIINDLFWKLPAVKDEEIGFLGRHSFPRAMLYHAGDFDSVALGVIPESNRRRAVWFLCVEGLEVLEHEHTNLGFDQVVDHAVLLVVGKRGYAVGDCLPHLRASAAETFD
jgi:hypothetical protein